MCNSRNTIFHVWRRHKICRLRYLQLVVVFLFFFFLVSGLWLLSKGGHIWSTYFSRLRLSFVFYPVNYGKYSKTYNLTYAYLLSYWIFVVYNRGSNRIKITYLAWPLCILCPMPRRRAIKFIQIAFRVLLKLSRTNNTSSVIKSNSRGVAKAKPTTMHENG